MTLDPAVCSPEQLAMSTVADGRRVVQRHAYLAAVAARAMVPRGFHGTSIRDFASAAGWSMGQLYRYISAKEDILFLVGRHVMDTLWGQLFTSERGRTPGETLHNAVKTLLDAVAPIADEVSAVYRESRSMKPEHRQIMMDAEMEAREYLASIIREGVATGAFASAVAPDLVAHDIILLAHMWALKGWAWQDRVSFADYRDHQLAFIERALVGPSGSAVYGRGCES
jgi:AcrR family transcriptional regulator